MEIIDNCQELHTLPRPGGLLAQDALFMYIYNQVRSFRDIRAQLDNNKTKSKAGV